MKRMSSQETMVIVTAQDFMLNITDFVRFKEKLGYKVEVITMDQVELSEHYRNIDDTTIDTTQIQAYIDVIQNSTTETLSQDVLTARAKRTCKLALALSSYLKEMRRKMSIDWVFIIGDFEAVPSRFYQALDDLEFFSDQLFVMENEERGPLFASIGRIPASNPEIVESICRKILNYEQTIHQYVNASDRNVDEFNWLRKSLLIVHEERDDTTNFDKGRDLIYNYLKDKLNVTILDATSTTKTDVINAINDGIVFIDYFGHGTENGWTSKNGIKINDLKELNNTRMLPFINSTSSYGGSIEKESFMEQIIERNSGAIGIIAPSTIKSTPNYENFNLAFYKAIFENHMNQPGKIFLELFNKILQENAYLLEPYEPSEGERAKVEERGENIDDYIKMKEKSRRRNFESLKAQILMQVLLGDPSLRLPFNLPDKEDDAPYEAPTELEPILTEPIPPEMVTLTPEMIFQEFQEKHRGIKNFLLHPRDLAKLSTLESSTITDYLYVSLTTLYYAHKRVTKTDQPESVYNQATFVQDPTPEPPSSIERKEQYFPIEGTQSSKTCSQCEGAGTLTCAYCNGSGTVQTGQCTHCDGTGKVQCDKCAGGGKLWSWEAEAYLWNPETIFREFTTIEGMTFNKYLAKIQPYGVVSLENLENMPDTRFPNKHIQDICLSGLKLLKRRAEARIGSLIGTVDRWKLEEIVMQEDKGIFTPIVELNCKYKGRPFTIYALGNDKQHILIEKNVPKNYFPLITIIIGVITAIILLLIFLP